jgi:hypothetical protein
MIHVDAKPIGALVIDLVILTDFPFDGFPHGNVNTNGLSIPCGTAIWIYFAVSLTLPYMASCEFTDDDTSKQSIEDSLIMHLSFPLDATEMVD